MKQLKTEIIIDAPAEKVWQLLTNLNDYHRWNPFISSAGEVVPGARISNDMLMDGKTMRFRPRIGQVVPGRSFEWTGHLLVPGLFDGNHYFDIEPLTPTQCKLTHGERFSGLLSAWLLKKIGAQTLQQFMAMNQALKQQAEK